MFLIEDPLVLYISAVGEYQFEDLHIYFGTSDVLLLLCPNEQANSILATGILFNLL